MVAVTAIVKAKRAPPSHPPFVDMITEAIVALKERTGSSQYAITKFVEEKHAHLPQSFKKLLLLNLKKLVASGKLVKVKASFKLPPRSSPAAAAPAKVKKTEVTKPKKTEASKAKKPAAVKTTAAKAKTAVKSKAKTVAKPKAKAAAKPSPAKKATVKKTKSVKKSPVKKKLAATKKIVKKPKSVKSPAKKVQPKRGKK